MAQGHADPLDPPPPPARWRFRLQVLTGLAVLVLAVAAISARTARTSVEGRREALRGALQRLVTAQEEYYVRQGRYAGMLDSVPGWQRPATLVIRFEARGDQAWRAVATDPELSLPPATCGVFVGEQMMAPHRAVLEPAVIGCW